MTPREEPDANHGDGLSDSDYALRRRKMLDIINALHQTGAHMDIDVPVESSWLSASRTPESRRSSSRSPG
ncbi:hypothetical protein L227DRAFT_577444 [Lentinus tigrinus ALCF2SS1-6]|uniref:Uncharacterized protein n=1 Tax=Lentinus tigrinus ALCF2SS1-6 TaxID=1328759 RepID=A0A5C2S3B0_9APHY|nr:hypothetical protein L227DRAFT_577444 [Lentinus tigrinus ALCF2SS1-6]